MSAKALTTRDLTRLRHTRWTTPTARAVLAAQEKSGESVAGFAQRHGLEPQRLYWWRNRLSEWSAAHDHGAPLLVPVVTPFSRVSRAELASPQLRLVCGEVQVELADAAAVSPEWLAAVVRALRARP
jgi:transposase-like protein